MVESSSMEPMGMESWLYTQKPTGLAAWETESAGDI